MRMYVCGGCDSSHLVAYNRALDGLLESPAVIHSRGH